MCHLLANLSIILNFNYLLPIATQHEGKKPYNCEICNAGFSQNVQLRAHIAVVHQGKSPYSCPICNKEFKQG